MADVIDQPTTGDSSDGPRSDQALDDSAELTNALDSDAPVRSTGSTIGAAAAGALAGAAALATGELLSGLSDKIPSLVVSVGEFMVDETPGSIARWSIDQFGSNQKTILVWGITIVSILVAAGVGIAAWRRMQRSTTGAFALAATVFAIFGIVGGLAGGRVPQASTGLAWLAAILAAFVGLTVLLGMLRRLATATRPVPDDALTMGGVTPSGSRRKFVNLLAGTGVAAAAAALFGRRLRGRYAVEDAREEVRTQLNNAPAAAPTAAPTVEAAAEATESGGGVMTGVANLDDAVDGITPLIVPNDEFYRIDAALVVPQVDPANWSVKITGMVDNEVEFTFDDLIARASVEEPVTLSCVSNRVGGDLVGNAVWLGVPLRELLDEAGVQAGASQIVGRSVDNWTGGFPLAHLDDPDVVALVAVGMNGEPLPVIHGFPARLVIAGLYGYVSATKWLEEIHLTRLEDFNGYWIDRGWSKLGPIKTQSRIDVPLSRNRRSLTPGSQPIAGVAWAPGRSVEKVEVQIDDGDWAEADLPEELSENSWRQWVYDWDATPGSHTIRVRATDGDGETQTAEITPPAPSGATGHHEIDVEVESI